MNDTAKLHNQNDDSLHGSALATTTTRRRLIALAIGLPVAASLAASPISLSGTSIALALPPVEAPTWQERFVLDSETIAWNDAGQRSAHGIVFHRLEGSLEGTDAYLRSLPAGGPNFCEASYGGCSNLFDFGIDHVTGDIFRWNDPAGASYPGVSPNRSGWANGPLDAPSPEATGFLADNGGDQALNRDQVSIAIAGRSDDPLSGDCILAIGWLSAYIADSAFSDASTYPNMDGKSYSFILKHQDFSAGKSCPGPAVEAAWPQIIQQTKDVFQFYRGV